MAEFTKTQYLRELNRIIRQLNALRLGATALGVEKGLSRAITAITDHKTDTMI